MLPELKSPCVVDTSVLVNFAVIDRLDLMGEQPTRRYVITPHVNAEVSEHYADERARLVTALGNGWLHGARLVEPHDVRRFTILLNRGLGPGSAAAVVAAVTWHWALASDSELVQKRARDLDADIAVVTTKQILIEAILAGLITVAQADEIKGRLHSFHRFYMPGFSSFEELLN